MLNAAILPIRANLSSVPSSKQKEQTYDHGKLDREHPAPHTNTMFISCHGDRTTIKKETIFSQRYINKYWLPIYIGQGDLQDRYDAALAEGCVESKNATHYHVRSNGNKVDREGEESDLIAGNTQCEWPNGCNGHD